jgi:charged multivesicular body protein 4
MDSIREQMDLTNEISDAISNPVGMGNQVDEVCLIHPPYQDMTGTDGQDELKAELEALEQEELDDRLAGAERAPIHAPTSPVGVTSGRERMPALFSLEIIADQEGVAQRAEEDDEEAQLRQLQAELAM